MFDYPNLITIVTQKGAPVDSRMGPTHEVNGLLLETTVGYVPTRVGFNKRLGYMELVQLLAGLYDPAEIARVAPHANHNLFTSQMAYGPRTAVQMAGIIRALKLDPLTRQAVLFVGKPYDGPSSDLPCTLTIQFLRRKGELRTLVSMRSWDLIKGLPYDLMMFGGLAMAVAHAVGDVATTLQVHAGSGHVYLEDNERVPNGNYLVFTPRFAQLDWEGIARQARRDVHAEWDDGHPSLFRDRLMEADHVD